MYVCKDQQKEAFLSAMTSTQADVAWMPHWGWSLGSHNNTEQREVSAKLCAFDLLWMDAF